MYTILYDVNMPLLFISFPKIKQQSSLLLKHIRYKISGFSDGAFRVTHDPPAGFGFGHQIAEADRRDDATRNQSGSEFI
jgi:hypothetical protein